MQASFAQGGVKIDLLPARAARCMPACARAAPGAIRLWIPDYFDAITIATAFAWNEW